MIVKHFTGMQSHVNSQWGRGTAPASHPCGEWFRWVIAVLLVLDVTSTVLTQAQSVFETVGRHRPDRTVTPVNQVVTPFGTQVDLPGLRPQGLALSPNGKLLVTSGKTSELVVIDPASGRILQRVSLPNDKQNEPDPDVASPNELQPDKEGQLSFTGLVFSPDGRRIYLSNVKGNIKVFRVDANGTVSAHFSIPLPPANAPRRSQEIPAGLAVSKDGRKLYVCLNLSNRLAELDAETGMVLRMFDVGVAPYDVAIARNKLYVSNWGGRRPTAGSLTGPAGRGTEVRVDPERFIASEGSVTVIDIKSGSVAGEVLAGLHASAVAVSPNERFVVCANAASDNLSVIDTRLDRVVETIWTKPNPAELLGASPNALAFDPRGRMLYVANGTQNAIAVIRFDPADRESRMLGLIPAGWFPGAVVFDGPRERLYVANIKGIGDRTGKSPEKVPGYNSHQYFGSLSLMPLPTASALARLSTQAWNNCRREQLLAAALPARAGQPTRPIPERIGEPSHFKHVVYIIKENRTYDQVLGDIPEGNGRSDLCIFGEAITPNQHRIAREFVLLDNTYCSGILSADGHQWSTTAFGTDYLEKSFADFPRSYPDGMGPDEQDALAYAPTGFLWDNARLHGKSVRNYGEFAMPNCHWADRTRKGSPQWLDFWKEYNDRAGEVIVGSIPSVDSLRSFTPTNTVGWNMDVPDVWRAEYFIKDLQQFEARGDLPNLILICLPNDHTSGTSKGSPTPAACVADNDLAFGRIVEALTRSRFWPEMVILAIEDDPQAGWDHVSGYRTTAYCISPYTRRRSVVSTQYNTTSILRTIEQILGLPPMNQFDATATPMFDCFTDRPDFTPYSSLPNQVALDQMNPGPNAISDPALRSDARMSARLNFRKVDACPEDTLNRILWRAMKGSREPYPEWAIAKVEDDDDE